MKNLLFTILLAILSSYSFGQGCGLVSGTKDKKTGIETKGGVVNSKDFYSLLIQKVIDKSIASDSQKYVLFLNAASRVMLPDSMLQTTGNFELLLADGKELIWENAKCFNDPLGLGASIGFQVEVTEDQIREILKVPIKKVKVFGILETEFAPSRLKQQQKIVHCLVSE